MQSIPLGCLSVQSIQISTAITSLYPSLTVHREGEGRVGRDREGEGGWVGERERGEREVGSRWGRRFNNEMFIT